jgi:LDH2 family malate/lactate/ureidoglycolate dehydrogenase
MTEEPMPADVEAEALAGFLAALFRATGLSAGAAACVGAALVEADLEGLPSHGTMQAEVYLRRLVAGGTSTAEAAEIVHDADAVAVLDAHDMLGHLSAEQAMALACDKAARYGLGAVAVRNAFHFGAAGRYARQAAEAGCIGWAMCNSRPVMPAPGGAQRLVGTNPIAIAVPTETDPVVFDMATSAGTVARLRLAAKAGQPIPDGWAVDSDGRPTIDPEAALKGMLLPMGGPKGFGLSLMVDLLSGLLSSGAWGDAVQGMHVDPAVPAAFSHFFLAIHIDHFRPSDGFRAAASTAVERVHNARRAPGTDRLRVPGERKIEAMRESGGRVRVPPVQVAALRRLASDLGVDPAPLG